MLNQNDTDYERGPAWSSGVAPGGVVAPRQGRPKNPIDRSDVQGPRRAICRAGAAPGSVDSVEVDVDMCRQSVLRAGVATGSVDPAGQRMKSEEKVSQPQGGGSTPVHSKENAAEFSSGPMASSSTTSSGTSQEKQKKGTMKQETRQALRRWRLTAAAQQRKCCSKC